MASNFLSRTKRFRPQGVISEDKRSDKRTIDPEETTGCIKYIRRRKTIEVLLGCLECFGIWLSMAVNDHLRL